jgi:hypothetical protein
MFFACPQKARPARHCLAWHSKCFCKTRRTLFSRFKVVKKNNWQAAAEKSSKHKLVSLLEPVYFSLPASVLHQLTTTLISNALSLAEARLGLGSLI